MTATKKPHMSPSAMDTYLRCGEQYRRAYVLGERIPPGVALIKGSGVHKGAEVNYKQKVESGVDISIDDMKAAAVEEIDLRVRHDGILLTKEESTVGASNVVGKIKDSAVKLVQIFGTDVAPNVQPVEVEKWLRVEIPSSRVDLLGKLDVVDSERNVRDIKTSSKKKQQEEADRSDQLTFYHAAYARETGEAPAGVVLDVLIEKAKPEVQIIKSTRSEKDLHVFVSRLNAVNNGIAAGSFPPASLGSWCCSPRFCGYWFTCPYVNSERAAAAESGS